MAQAVAATSRSGRTAARDSLGRRMALVLLPLVLIPLLVMAGAAYLRTRAILRGVAARQITSATQSQSTVLLTWVEDREQQLLLSSQRASLRELIAPLLPVPAPSDQASLEAARAELSTIANRPGEDLFTDLIVADAATGQVIVATLRDWERQPLLPPGQLLSAEATLRTMPAVDNPLVSPASLALLTVAPMRTGRSETPDVVLVGVNRGIAVGQLLEQLQVFTEHSGPYLVRRGLSSFLIPADTLVRVTGYGGAYEVVRPIEHPVLEGDPSPDIRTLEYNDPEGTPVIAAAQWYPEWGWTVVNELPQSEVYSELNSLAPFTGAILAAAAILSVVTVALVTGRLLRPLGTLTEMAGRVSRGDWSFRVPEAREDELGLLASAFNRMAEDLSGMYRSLEARVEERTRQVRTAAEVAHAVTSTPALDELMRRAVELIRERFNYHHVAIFLLDEKGEQAVLREATGEVGAAMVARGHKVGVGAASTIGWVALNRQPRVASDLAMDSMHLKSELLPGTRSEAAVPLRVGDRTLGVLDVQSLEPHAFGAEDLTMLQTLADQLSAAIQNARLAQTSSVAAERARLISEVTSQLTGLLDADKVLSTTAQIVHRAMGHPEVLVQAYRPLEPGEA